VGIRISSQVLFGIELSNKASNAIIKYKDKNGYDSIVIKMIEEYAKLKERTQDLHFSKIKEKDDCTFWEFDTLMKRTKKGRFSRPITTLWSKYSNKKVKVITEYLEDIDELLTNGQKQHMSRRYSNDPVLEGEKLDSAARREVEKARKLVFIPDEDISGNVLGIVYGERRYNDEVDWALSETLGYASENKLIDVSGKRPWEVGVQENNGKWSIFNGQHLIPESRFSGDNSKLADEDQELFKRCLSYGFSSKKKLTDTAKKLFTSYSKKSPYYTSAHSGWWGDIFHYNRLSFIIRTISKIIPEVKFDFMKMKKYVYFYWR